MCKFWYDRWNCKKTLVKTRWKTNLFRYQILLIAFLSYVMKKGHICSSFWTLKNSKFLDRAHGQWLKRFEVEHTTLTTLRLCLMNWNGLIRMWLKPNQRFPRSWKAGRTDKFSQYNCNCIPESLTTSTVWKLCKYGNWLNRTVVNQISQKL